ncbi:hypothetical protein [Actinomycetospora sp. NBRC 106375]|nr:hypothetical protein [Actinomycetospora sp. NBRC 106375]
MIDVSVVDVAPRDGLHNESTVFSVKDRVVLISRLVAVGAQPERRR